MTLFGTPKSDSKARFETGDYERMAISSHESDLFSSDCSHIGIVVSRSLRVSL